MKPITATMLTLLIVTLFLSPVSAIESQVSSSEINNLNRDGLSYKPPIINLNKHEKQNRKQNSMVYSIGNQYQHQYINGEFLIKITTDAPINLHTNPQGIIQTGISSLDNLNKKYRITSYEPIIKQPLHKNASSPFATLYKITLTGTAETSKIIQEFRYNPHIAIAEPNYLLSTSIIPNDPSFTQQWALHNTGQTGGLYDADIDAPEAWNITTGDNKVIIAILDTGVDWDHPDLADNIWINTGEDLNGNGIVDPTDFNNHDDDNNGFIDDIRGWDFVNLENKDERIILDPNEDGFKEDNNPMDFHGHGTHCSGIAAAVTNNQRGVAGVCWNGSIMAVRAGFKTTWFGAAALVTEDILQGIVYATDNQADIISMSFGIPRYIESIKDAVDYAADHGVLLVAAAGNDNSSTLSYPAAFEPVLSVAATTHNDKKATFSNHGTWIDIAAPGVNIHSTVFDNNYISLNGTSMATPYVAGVMGLLLSKNQSLTLPMIQTILFNTADPINSTQQLGHGRINAYTAITREPAIAQITKNRHWTNITGTHTITGTAWGTLFQKYHLHYRKTDNHSTPWIELANTTTMVTNGTLAILNTTSLSDGRYTLRLTLRCTDGTYIDHTPIITNNHHNHFIVDDDNTEGPWYGTQTHPYQHISDAVLNTGDKDTVYVKNGTYPETITIQAPIDITGEHPTTTILSGNHLNTATAFTLQTNNITLSNLTIKNYTTAILCTLLTTNTLISNNHLHHNFHGIVTTYSNHHTTITTNLLTDCQSGIEINAFSNNTTIAYNHLRNVGLIGIGISESTNTYIYHNQLSAHQTPMLLANFGILLYQSHHNMITGNHIIDYFALINMTLTFFGIPLNITQPASAALYLLYSSNNNISHNHLLNNSLGIVLIYSSDNQILTNNFINNYRHARFANSHNEWEKNYWNRPHLLPKLILGKKGTLGLIPSIQFDWQPALKPSIIT